MNMDKERAKKWIKKLEELLLSGKYCWANNELQADEFYGLDGEMGFYDHAVDFVSEVEKKAFIEGFFLGALEVCREDETIDRAVNTITAERRYLGWR